MKNLSSSILEELTEGIKEDNVFRATPSEEVSELNPEYTINIPEKKITSGSRYWEYETIEEFLEAIDKLKREIEEDNR